MPSKTARDLHPNDCYVCGTENQHSLNVSVPFDIENGEVEFTHHFQGFEKGAPGKKRLVHGGAIAAIMDEVQGVLAHHVGHLVMTDQLHIRYHKGTVLAEPVKIQAIVTTVRKRRLYTRATMHNEAGDLLVSSSAKWFLLPDRMIKKTFQEVGSDVEAPGFNFEMIEANRKRARQIRKQRKAKKSHQ